MQGFVLIVNWGVKTYPECGETISQTEPESFKSNASQQVGSMAAIIAPSFWLWEWRDFPTTDFPAIINENLEYKPTKYVVFCLDISSEPQKGN